MTETGIRRWTRSPISSSDTPPERSPARNWQLRWFAVGTASLLLIQCPLLAGVVCASAGQWQLDTIASGVSEAARNSSLAIDSSGTIHVLYYDQTEANQFVLKHAAQTQTGWSSEVIDQAKGDQAVIRIDSANRIHIAYNQIVGQEEVRYGVFDNGIWTLEDVHSSAFRGREPMLVLDSNDQPRVAFQDNGGMGYAAYYAAKNGSAWTIEQVGSKSGDFILGGPGLGSDDRPSLFAGRSDLGFGVATRGSSNWSIQSHLGAALFPPNIASDADSLGNFHVAGVTFGPTDDLYYLVGKDTTWSSQLIEHTGPIGLANTSIAFGLNGLPRISYEVNLDRSGRTRIKHAYYTGSEWITEFVSADTAVQSGTSLAVDAAGVSHIVYWAADGRLVHATAYVPEPNTFVLAAVGLSMLYLARKSIHVLVR